MHMGKSKVAQPTLMGLAIVLSVLGLGAAGLHYGFREAPDGPRSAAWAQQMQCDGVPNFHRVSDGLYRGAQPTAEGFKQLKKMGIKTVVNLRLAHSDRDEIGDTALKYEHINMAAWNPENDDVVRFLKIVTNKENQPVFVHCQHGSDRTGTMCAIYRIAVQGWDRDEALKEMTTGGYGFHEVWDELPKYIRGLDVKSIRLQAGLEPEP